LFLDPSNYLGHIKIIFTWINFNSRLNKDLYREILKLTSYEFSNNMK
jgi:hypothetical protein